VTERTIAIHDGNTSSRNIGNASITAAFINSKVTNIQWC
jgi:hypothetical protein